LRTFGAAPRERARGAGRAEGVYDGKGRRPKGRREQASIGTQRLLLVKSSI